MALVSVSIVNSIFEEVLVDPATSAALAKTVGDSYVVFFYVAVVVLAGITLIHEFRQHKRKKFFKALKFVGGGRQPVAK